MAGTDDALRLGWTVAEVRGLCNPDGPRPTENQVPATPAHILPLRSERSAEAARSACTETAKALAKKLTVSDVDWVEANVTQAVVANQDRDAWLEHSRFFHEWDGKIQDRLTRDDEQLANAYLLGRGLAECYWGLGADHEWSGPDGRPTGAAPGFLLSEARRVELTRMLGRLRPGNVHSLTPAAISGSLEAWGLVVKNPGSVDPGPLRENLYEQVRRWYQLLVLEQDPTTLVRPYARLRDIHHLNRTLRLMWPQALVGLLLVALATWLLATDKLTTLGSLLGAGGTGLVGTVLVVAGGLVARARNKAQLWATRLRQDAYTDLVAADITVLPQLRRSPDEKRFRQGRDLIEYAVRQRILTPPTTAPDSTG